MLDGPSSRELAGQLVWEPVVSSWRGGTWLANVPVSSGSVTWSTRRQVPGSLDLRVPRLSIVDGRSFDWMPGNDWRHPLARFGQELVVSLRVGTLVSSKRWLIPVIRALITDWDDEYGEIVVTGASMFQRIEDARLTSPQPSRSSGSLESEMRRLLPASLGLSVDDDLTDRSCPAMSWGESRMDALLEIARAWPARFREDRRGAAWALPPLDAVPMPLDTLTDGEGGTVVGAYRSDSREGAFNVMVVRGQDSTDSGVPAVQSVAEQPTGPMAANGPYGYVPKFFSSPLISNHGVARNTAWAMLRDSLRPSRTVPVTLAPDPRWELDDAVEVVTERDRFWGYVSGLQIPLTPGDGDMRMDVEVPS